MLSMTPESKHRRKTRGVPRLYCQFPGQSISFYTHGMAHDTSTAPEDWGFEWRAIRPYRSANAPSGGDEQALQTDHRWARSPAALPDRIDKPTNIDGKAPHPRSRQIHALSANKKCQLAAGTDKEDSATHTKRWLENWANGATTIAA